MNFASGIAMRCAFKCEVDRTLLDDAVDVMPPWVTIEQAVDGNAQFLVHSMQHVAAHHEAAGQSLLSECSCVFPRIDLR